MLDCLSANPPYGLNLLSDKVRYQAMVEVSVYSGDADPCQMLLVFGIAIDTAALQAYIKTELSAEYLPLLPQRNTAGGAD